MIRTGISVTAVAVALLASPAQAQDRSETDDSAEIIVTAQKREQNLQDVPVVVTVLSSTQLENAGVRDIKDLQAITPGLNVTSSTSQAQTSIRIRGVGTIGDNPGLESSVGTVIDGVYRARSSVAFGDLGELERVEILKGPQSTLFGKNMSAGVISVITAPPTYDFGGEVTATYGDHNELGFTASLNAPLVPDKLAVRFFGAKRQRDGFMVVRTGGGPRQENRDANLNYYVVRGQLLFEPTPDLTIRVIGDHSRRNENCCLDTPTLTGATGALVDALAPDAGTVRPADPFARVTYANRGTPTIISDSGVSIDAEYSFGGSGFGLRSITAWRNWRGQNGTDLDFSTADIWYRDLDSNSNEFNVFSQELRFSYTSDRLNSIVGVFYNNEDLVSLNSIRFGTAYENYFGLLLSSGANPATVSVLTGLPVGTNFRAGEGSLDRFDHQAEGIAVFTNNAITITDGLELTLGLRYTDEVKQVSSAYRNTIPATACAAALTRPVPAAAVAAICAPQADSAFNNINTQQRRREARWSGDVKLAYRFSPAVMAYASYANGFKSGGFNLDRAKLAPGVINTNTAFPAETVESFEVGAKFTLADRRLLFNVAGFHQTYRGFQLNTFTGVSWLVASIPEVTSKGVDVDLLWNTPIEGLSINAGATYADTRYGAFTPPAGISTRLPNNRLSYAPEWNLTGGFDYRAPIGGGLQLLASGSVKWTSEYNTGSNLDPLKLQPAFALVNGRIGIGSDPAGWSLELWAQNLFDVNYYQVIVDQPLQSGTYGGYLAPPRTFGVTGRIRF